MSSLNRALALSQMDEIAVLIAEDLNLDVTSGLYILFDVDRWIAEGELRLLLSSRQRGKQLLAVADYAHSAAAATRGCLDDHRIPDLAAIRAASSSSSITPSNPELSGHPQPSSRRAPALCHPLVGLFGGARADKLYVAGFAHFGKIGILRQEAVAGVNRVNIGYLGGGYDGGILR